MKMTVSYQWLCELVPDLSSKTPEEIGSAFTDFGAETEEITLLQSDPRIQLGQILSIEELPKNVLVKIQTESGVFQTISDSSRLAVNNFVIFAPVGSKIAQNITVEKKNIQNIQTDGMLLAYEHFGIENKSNEIIILTESKDFAYEFFKELTKNDALYELEIPGNRSDWLSVRGLAEGLAAYFKYPLKTNSFHSLQSLHHTQITISVDSSNCLRYILCGIDNISNMPSHPSIQKKLLMLGMRPINFLVDLSNMVMLETGQPLHAFDASKIKGNIHIRQASSGETLELLDSSVIELTENDLIICDQEKILALAGIMGGLSSSIDKNTTKVYLESANFRHITIRRTAKRLGIKTESSLRFEKHISPELVNGALLSYIQNIYSHFPNASVSKPFDYYPKPYQGSPIHITPNEIRNYLGAPDISDDTIRNIITLSHCKLECQKNSWTVIPTGMRTDINIKEDIIEEIARFYGYNNIPSTSYRPSSITLSPEQSFEEKIKPLLRGMGIHEAVTVGFRSPKQREFFKISYPQPAIIVNPLNAEWTEMRTHLFDGLLDIVKYNSSKAFEKNTTFSEIGTVFSKDKDHFIEEKKLSLIMNSEQSCYTKGLNILNNIFEYAGLKNISAKKIDPNKLGFLHPLNSFEIISLDRSIGFFGEIHPELLYKCDLSDKSNHPAPIVCEILFEALEGNSLNKSFTPIPALPPVFRDITLCIPEKEFGLNIKTHIQSMHPDLTHIEFLSIFQNQELKEQQRKNLSLRLRFESFNILEAKDIDLFLQHLLKTYQ
ncbi:MAG: phenylalanine--tRNA ligase subunit beta [Brevinemataceae bacterium]